MPEIISRTDKSVRIRTYSRLWQFMSDHRISFGPHTWHDIETIEVPDDCRLEAYSIFYNGGHILTDMGLGSHQLTKHVVGPMGRYCSVASGVSAMGERHPIEHVTTSSFLYQSERPSFDWMREDFGITKRVPRSTPDGPLPVLGHDVWIADDALLARGITLGHGCVVGARAVVTKDVARYTIVAGNPARVIRKRFPDQIVEQLLDLEWWNLHPRVLFCHDVRDPESFIATVRAAKSAREPYTPCSIGAADILAVN
jgi:acetyltransferase-like isoleucine patch superfamily enzyme